MPKSTIFMILIVSFFVTFNMAEYSQTTGNQEEKLKARFFEALEKGEGAVAKKFLEENPGLATAAEEGGWTPLHSCILNPELIEYLIAKGADVHAQTDGGWTPLHAHAYWGTPEGVKLLIKHGARVNQKHAHGMTPLMSTLRRRKTAETVGYENLRILAENGAKLNVTDTLGRTPLILASIKGFSKLTALLLKMGADISVADLPTQRTALHFASLYGHLDIVKQLMAGGADLEKLDSYGHMPSYYAGRYGHQKVWEYLKSAVSEGKNDRSRFGFSPRLKKKIPKGEASIWFLGFIGYAVKTSNHFLVFSYYNAGNLPTETTLSGGYLTIDEIKNQNITVFAGSNSHHHHNPKRYKMWQNRLKNVRFVYSFEDKVGTRNSHYMEDVPGPDNIYIPEGKKKSVDGIVIESLAIPAPGTGFLVDVDGLVICHTGYLFVSNESKMEDYKIFVQYLKDKGKQIDILFQMGTYQYGWLVPTNVQAIDYLLGILKPRSLFLMGPQECEYLLEEVKGSLKKHESHTGIHAPHHQGDWFNYTVNKRDGG